VGRIVTEVQTATSRYHISIPSGGRRFAFTQHLIRYVPRFRFNELQRSWCEAGHLAPSSFEVKNTWSHTSNDVHMDNLSLRTVMDVLKWLNRND
jgi:hypothetical protein